MFDRLTMKQSEADDQVLFIRKGKKTFHWLFLVSTLFSANQKRVETESQIKKIKEDLANVEQEKNDENEIRSEKIESLKEDIKQVCSTSRTFNNFTAHLRLVCGKITCLAE